MQNVPGWDGWHSESRYAAIYSWLKAPFMFKDLFLILLPKLDRCRVRNLQCTILFKHVSRFCSSLLPFQSKS